MAHGTGIINAPVTLPYDIAAVLGIKGYDVAATCQSAAINMWAKYKPVNIAQKQVVTENQLRGVNYGIINIPTWTNTLIGSVASFVFDREGTPPQCGDKAIYWGYGRPQTYFRLSDFASPDRTLGYYHEAEAPLGKLTSRNLTIESGGQLTILYAAGAQSSRTIALTDLTFLGIQASVANMYLGVCMRKSGTTTLHVVATTPVSDIGSPQAAVRIQGLTSAFNGVYQIFPFLSTDQIAYTTSVGHLSSDFICFGCEAETVSIGTKIVTMDIAEHSFSAYRDYSQSNRILYANVTLVNAVYGGSLGAEVYVEVFNESGTTLSTFRRDTTTNVPQGASVLHPMQLDMGSLGNLRSAYSLRITVTPKSVTNAATTSATCTVSDGPSPFA